MEEIQAPEAMAAHGQKKKLKRIYFVLTPLLSLPGCCTSSLSLRNKLLRKDSPSVHANSSQLIEFLEMKH